jgi:hypothetical protein
MANVDRLRESISLLNNTLINVTADSGTKRDYLPATGGGVLCAPSPSQK